MTSPSPLDRLAGPGNVLAKEPPDAKEFAGLVRSALARLKDAESDANSLDSRFDLAYRDSKLIVKWDLDNQKPMKGAATRRILELIGELEAEGLL